jgi:hypothetical protein
VTTPARKTPFDRDHKPDDRTVHGRAQPSERDRHDGRSPLITQTKISKTTPFDLNNHPDKRRELGRVQAPLESNNNFEVEPDNPSKSSRGSNPALKSNALSAATAVPPELVERVAALERLAADQARMIEAQEGRIAKLEARPADDEDGRARPPGTWLGMKRAVAATGYSESGLRKMVKERRCAADFEGCHVLINVDTVPRRGAKVLVESALLPAHPLD